VILVIIGAGVAAAALISGGGGSDPVTSDAVIPSTTALTTVTATTPTTTPTTAQSSQTQVQNAVTSYVQAAEEGDATTLCALQSGGAATSSAQACAAKLGISLADLPSVTKLKLGSVSVKGDKATVQLVSVGELTLVKSSAGWRISSFKPSNAAPSGGTSPGQGSNAGGARPD